jgi:hypothetical protein
MVRRPTARGFEGWANMVSEVFNECVGLFSTVESLAFNHIPGLADFTGLIVQM